MTDSNDNGKTFCSSKGLSLELRPVSQFKIDSLRASSDEIEPPTYMMNVLGEQRPHPMDETIAKNQGRLDEWNAYLAAKAKHESEKAKKFSTLLIWEGVNVEVPGLDSEWQKLQDALGIRVPVDPIERKLHFVYNEFLVGQEDLTNLISQILSVSQIDEEVVRKIRESFRSQKKRNADLPVQPRKRKVAVR